MGTDVRQDWFMNQHFSKEELEKIYAWEQSSGKIACIVSTEEGFKLFHINDTNHEIDLCVMKEEYMLRRWSERLGYTTNDGKTAKQFEEENGIKDAPVVVGEEIYREELTSISFFKDTKKFQIVSGDYAVVANRTASNSYEILLLTSEQYAEYLKQNKKP